MLKVNKKQLQVAEIFQKLKKVLRYFWAHCLIDCGSNDVQLNSVKSCIYIYEDLSMQNKNIFDVVYISTAQALYFFACLWWLWWRWRGWRQEECVYRS